MFLVSLFYKSLTEWVHVRPVGNTSQSCTSWFSHFWSETRCRTLSNWRLIFLCLGGMFFAKPVRERGYITSMDVLQEKYGNKITILLILPSFLGDILWLAGILASLGCSTVRTASISCVDRNSLLTDFMGFLNIEWTNQGRSYPLFWTSIAT